MVNSLMLIFLIFLSAFVHNCYGVKTRTGKLRLVTRKQISPEPQLVNTDTVKIVLPQLITTSNKNKRYRVMMPSDRVTPAIDEEELNGVQESEQRQEQESLEIEQRRYEETTSSPQTTTSTSTPSTTPDVIIVKEVKYENVKEIHWVPVKKETLKKVSRKTGKPISEVMITTRLNENQPLGSENPGAPGFGMYQDMDSRSNVQMNPFSSGMGNFGLMSQSMGQYEPMKQAMAMPGMRTGIPMTFNYPSAMYPAYPIPMQLPPQQSSAAVSPSPPSHPESA